MELEELTNEQIAENISELCKNKNYHKIKDILIEINPTDVAAIFEELPTEQRLLLFRLLPKEEAAETFVELNGDTQEALITAFSDTELKEVIDELYLDDTVDIIEEMPATVVKRILKNTDTQTRKSIYSLLKYPEANSLLKLFSTFTLKLHGSIKLNFTTPFYPKIQLIKQHYFIQKNSQFYNPCQNRQKKCKN